MKYPAQGRLPQAIAFLLLALCPGLLRADWAVVENFESGFTIGSTIHGVNGWVVDAPLNATAVIDPAASGRGTVARVVQSGARNDLYKPLGARQVANGATATMFFEAYFPAAGAGAANISAGLSDAVSPVIPNDYAALEPQFRWLAGDIHPRNGVLGFADTGYDFASGTRMRVWLVVNNSTDTVDMHVESPVGSAGRVLVADNFGFRNGLAGNALTSFMLIQSTGQDIYFDNLYIDNTGENLGLPPIPGSEPVAHNDAVQVGIGGSIGFAPLANDTGFINPASLQIISPPAHGSAVFDPAKGKIVYRHAGGSPGGDTFRYRITRQGGGATSEADVNVMINGNLRLANATLNVPLTPPAASAGTLAIKNGLPASASRARSA